MVKIQKFLAKRLLSTVSLQIQLTFGILSLLLKIVVLLALLPLIIVSNMHAATVLTILDLVILTLFTTESFLHMITFKKYYYRRARFVRMSLITLLFATILNIMNLSQFTSNEADINGGTSNYFYLVP